MSHKILGVGTGVFIVTALWICALSLAVIFSKARRPISFLSIGSILIAFLITLVLFFIPRGHQISKIETELLPPDYLFIWRCALLVLLIISFVIAIIFMITEHWSIPMPAKALKKVAQKTYISAIN